MGLFLGAMGGLGGAMQRGGRIVLSNKLEQIRQERLASIQSVEKQKDRDAAAKRQRGIFNATAEQNRLNRDAAAKRQQESFDAAAEQQQRGFDAAAERRQNGKELKTGQSGDLTQNQIESTKYLRDFHAEKMIKNDEEISRIASDMTLEPEEANARIADLRAKNLEHKEKFDKAQNILLGRELSGQISGRSILGKPNQVDANQVDASQVENAGAQTQKKMFLNLIHQGNPNQVIANFIANLPGNVTQEQREMVINNFFGGVQNPNEIIPEHVIDKLYRNGLNQDSIEKLLLAAYPYRLFFSHSWAHNDDYEKLKNLLDNKFLFFYSDHSVPKNDPIHNASNDSQLDKAIKDKISEVDAVVILAGVYGTYSKWINKEIKIANEFNPRKPIIAVELRGSERSSNVKMNADKIVKWNGDSIIKAIRELV